MKRRTFGLFAGSSMLALQAGIPKAQAATDYSVGPGLTPLGSEQAGNADGSIPPWTGGLTAMPAGMDPTNFGVELWPDEKVILTIDASNMAEHANMLSASLMTMMTKYGFKINVYPTHRTSAASEFIYQNNVANVTRAKFSAADPVGGRFGFTGGFGGWPFPVPDVSNPLAAGAQIMWNNNCTLRGFCTLNHFEAYAVSGGHSSLGFAANTQYRCPYFDPDLGPDTYGNILYKATNPYTGPANLVGQNLVIYTYSDPAQQPQLAWELLNGQGRVRRAPNISFDTPSSQADGIIGYDEYYGFTGSLEKYDWKYVGKQEMYIPYNNNRMVGSSPDDVIQTHFIDPAVQRWEKHRCWVVEATLHPGERNVLAKRRFYVDEDTWVVALSDGYDANNNLFKAGIVYNWCRPDQPVVRFGQATVNNLQTDDWCVTSGHWRSTPQHPQVTYLTTPWPESLFDPNNLAASAQY